MPVYYFNNEGVTYRLRNKRLITKWLQASCHQENHQLHSLNIVLCSDGQLLKINTDHLDHHDFTDIITFDFSQDKKIDGELYISIDRVRDNAKSHKIKIEDEINRIIIHGVLHMMGYNDKTPSEKLAMTKMEDHYLSQRSF